MSNKREPEHYWAINVPEMWLYNEEDKVVSAQEGPGSSQILAAAPNKKPVQE